MNSRTRNLLEFAGFIAVVLAATCLKDLSCSKADNCPKSSIKCVYIDMAGTLHVSDSCHGIARFGYRRDIDTLNIDDITKKNLNKICSRCVKTEDLEYLTIESATK